MTSNSRQKLDDCLEEFACRLPEKLGGFVRWFNGPTITWLRIPLGIALVVGGIVGVFLPVLGFWMVPLGLVLIARDVPFLRPPLIHLLRWINRKMPRRRESH
jgi:4-alpha-glucanotransferase